MPVRSDAPAFRNECKRNSSDRESKVIVQPLGKSNAIDPQEWPSGEFLANFGTTITEREGLSNTSTNQYQSKSADQVTTREWWQASARRAILEKFGYYTSHSNSCTSDDATKSVDRTFLPGEVDGIQRLWEKLVLEIIGQRIGRSDNEEDISLCLHGSMRTDCDLSHHHRDFIDFVVNQCRKSNNRQLQWNIMSCPRGVQFSLHAHPNLELIYCIRGLLFEIRMLGEPITRTFEESETIDDLENNAKVVGPNLTHLKRNWSFGTLKAGQWLVNEIGSIHKSFTSARSDGGCDLLVLWGGSHANIVDPPISPNIQKAVDTMEDKLQIDDSCCMHSKIRFVPETFLPDSER